MSGQYCTAHSFSAVHPVHPARLHGGFVEGRVGMLDSASEWATINRLLLRQGL